MICRQPPLSDSREQGFRRSALAFPRRAGRNQPEPVESLTVLIDRKRLDLPGVARELMVWMIGCLNGTTLTLRARTGRAERVDPLLSIKTTDAW